MKITDREFRVNFMLSKTKVFEVGYYTCGGNKEPYFSTSADVFNRPKTDFNRCGQCQNDVLHGYGVAMNFFQKWDKMHLHKMTDDEYIEMIMDLELLFEKYPFILYQADKNPKNIPFGELRKLSMTVYRGNKSKEV